MILVKFGDRGPLVVAFQILINRRRSRKNAIGVDGIFGANTRTAVQQFQRTKHVSDTGNVTEETWPRLIEGSGLTMVDAASVCDPELQDDEDFLRGHGANPIPIKCMDNGVSYVVDKVTARVRLPQSLVLLRIWGHGWVHRPAILMGEDDSLKRAEQVLSAITPKTLPRLRATLLKLRPLFAPLGNVEFRNCLVAKWPEGERMLADLASLLNVPVSAPRYDTLGISWRFEDQVIHPLGKAARAVCTKYPGPRTLASWAKHQYELEQKGRSRVLVR